MTKSVSLAILLPAVLALLVGGCTDKDAPPPSRDTVAHRADTPRPVRIQPPITAADIRGTTLSLHDIDTILSLTGRGPVTLVDSVFSDTLAAVTVTALPSLLVGAAPAPDGTRRAVVPVLVETGGSGVFVHLLAFERGESGLRQTGETFLGDRVKIESIGLHGDTAVLGMVVHDEGDERCCPSLKAEKFYLLSTSAPQLVAQKMAPKPPTAAMFNGESGGCGSFQVFRYNTAFTSLIQFGVNADSLAISNGTTTLAVTPNSGGIDLRIVQFAEPVPHYVCSDFGARPQPVATWRAISGQVRLKVSGKATAGAPTPQSSEYRVSVVMSNVVLENEATKETCRLGSVRIENVDVGWIPG